MSQHDDLVRYIQSSVDSICPYKNDERMHRLYHVGFLVSYLATFMEKDPYNFRVFQNHIERLKRMNKKL